MQVKLQSKPMKHLIRSIFILSILCCASLSRENTYRSNFVDPLFGSWRSYRKSKGQCQQVDPRCAKQEQSSKTLIGCQSGFKLPNREYVRIQKDNIGASALITKKISLPDLDYSYAALEPAISAKIMELHHSKHHSGYVNNLKLALQQFEQAKNSLDFNKMASLLQTIRFNLGGHINHSIFWKNLAPISLGGGKFPESNSPFTHQVIKQFGSYEKLIDQITKKTVSIQGSGWGWLGYDQIGQSLKIMETANQDMLAPSGLIPLLGIDVWEHAYYLDYLNVRATYLKQIWKVVNWKDVQSRFLSAIQK